MSITIEKYENQNGIYVLRDDLLPGGTKSILLDSIIKRGAMPPSDPQLQGGVLPPSDPQMNGGAMTPFVNEFVYASPCYGGFQIALSIFCKNNNKKATIFCAQRKIRHPNTEICIKNGANVIEVPYGYLSVVEKHAREYLRLREPGFPHTPSLQTKGIILGAGGVLGAQYLAPLVPLKIAFGANSPESINIIASRARRVIETFHTTYGKPPDEIWCAVGSGTLISGITQAVNEMQGAQCLTPNCQALSTTLEKGHVEAVPCSKGSEGTACPLKIYGVQVGKEFKGSNSPNVTIIVYPKPFEYASKLKVDFPSMQNYDLKAFELCLEYNKNKSITSNIDENKKVLFWNVL
uniref:Tryptophan synthase beta chain-like PALP domain-containing protein n=1 Tax=viral metagenome TaxID=1070528 RepID=A0A6C0I1S0_9ZZZZ